MPAGSPDSTAEGVMARCAMYVAIGVVAIIVLIGVGIGALIG